MSKENCCRLCSAKKNLISMFSGKLRTLRDFLRKMIENTVQIQIEQHDGVPSICFNCAVDVSNFYFFKLHCQQNERQFKDVISSGFKAKKRKLQALELKDIQLPNIESTEEVLVWLVDKRASLMATSETRVNKNTQTYQILCDMGVQYDERKIYSNQSQTTSPKFVNSEVQCDEIKPQLPLKIDMGAQCDQRKIYSKKSQTTNPKLVNTEVQCDEINPQLNLKIDMGTPYDKRKIYSKESQTTGPKLVNSEVQCDEINPQLPQKMDMGEQCGKRKIYSKESQTTGPKLVNSEVQCDEINPQLPLKILLKTRASQTGPSKTESSKCNVCNNEPLRKKTQNCHTQTTNSKVDSLLSQTDDSLKTNFEDSSCQTDINNIVSTCSQTEYEELKPKFQDGCAQTESLKYVSKGLQCDTLKLSRYKNSLWYNRAKSPVNPRDKNDYKIADSLMFSDALLNGFDNIYVSKMTQTELPMCHCEQFNSSNSYFEKSSLLLPPSTNSFFKDIDSKLSISVLFPEKLKEEKISPTESVPSSADQSPNGMLSPQSSELLQVNHNKSDHVKICKLCDTTLYNRKEVTLHNKTHTQCNICKRKFRSLKATQIHMEDCKVQEADRLPFVNLVRFDLISTPKEKCSKAIQ